MRLLLIFCLGLFFNTGVAQITITNNDLPAAGQVFQVTISQPDSSIDPAITGPAHTWDFSQLVMAASRIDSFIDETATGQAYSFFFIDNSLNPNRSNHASPGQGFSIGTQINLSDVDNFFYSDGTKYEQAGLGANVNGLPAPVAFSPHDRIYKLPLNYPQLDSSATGFVIDLTSTLGIYVEVDRMRVNEVDGWGTLTTPYGTFDVLRVKSTLREQDSIYIDSLGFGFSLPEFTTVEYKWLGAGQSIPLLQINTAINGTVTEVWYKDSLINTGITSPGNISLSMMAYPNPSNGTQMMRIDSEKALDAMLRITTISGSVVSSKNFRLKNGVNEVSIPSELPAGIYNATLWTEGRMVQTVRVMLE